MASAMPRHPGLLVRPRSKSASRFELGAKPNQSLETAFLSPKESKAQRSEIASKPHGGAIQIAPHPNQLDVPIPQQNIIRPTIEMQEMTKWEKEVHASAVLYGFLPPSGEINPSVFVPDHIETLPPPEKGEDPYKSEDAWEVQATSYSQRDFEAIQPDVCWRMGNELIKNESITYSRLPILPDNAPPHGWFNGCPWISGCFTNASRIAGYTHEDDDIHVFCVLCQIRSPESLGILFAAT
jgi:hypothetical protein